MCGRIHPGFGFAGAMVLEKVMPHTVRTADSLKRGTPRHTSMGDPSAPIPVIEYGDFQCPFCMKCWVETEPLLIEEYMNTGAVYFEYHSLGKFLGVDFARAAQDAYWAGDRRGEDPGDFTNEKLIRYTEPVMRDVGTFASCLEEGNHKETVEQDAAQTQAGAVHATPTFIINGRQVEGEQPFSAFEQIPGEILRSDLDTVNG
jgi:protein-disulfide isomerase